MSTRVTSVSPLLVLAVLRSIWRLCNIFGASLPPAIGGRVIKVQPCARCTGDVTCVTNGSPRNLNWSIYTLHTIHTRDTIQAI